MGYQIITNGQKRELLSKSQLSKRDAADFDYVDDEHESRFVVYRGRAFDVFDSQRIRVRSEKSGPVGYEFPVHAGEPLARFDCIITDSFFSAVAFKLCDEGDCVICATLYS